MMLTSARFCLIVAVFLLSSVATADASDAEEYFDKLPGSEDGVMTSNSFKEILSALAKRLHSIEACFSHDYFKNSGSEITVEGFVNVSRLITKFIVDKNCSEEENEITTDVDPHSIVDSLREIGYQGTHTNECFNEFMLRDDTGPARTTAFVLYLYEGWCLLPTKYYFDSQYKSSFLDEHGVASPDGFENLLTQLNIGQSPDHHEGHDHAEHDHDHSDHADKGHGDHDHEGHDHGDHGHSDHGRDGGSHGNHEDHDSHDDDDSHGHSHGGHDHSDHGSNDDGDNHGHSHGGHDHSDHGSNDDDDSHASHGGHDHSDHGSDDDDDSHGHSHGGHDHSDHGSDGGSDDDVTTVPDDHVTPQTAVDDETTLSVDHETTLPVDDVTTVKPDAAGTGQGHDHHHNHATTVPTDRSESHDEHGHNHGHDHNRRRRSTQDTSTKPQCFTHRQLLDIYEVEGDISDAKAIELCPALIQQIKSKACADNHDSHDVVAYHYTEAMIYGYGTAAVAIISLLALLGLLLFPVLKSKTYDIIMQFFVGLAIGTMASDALIHIIPHALGLHNHDSHDDHAHGHGAEDEDMTFVWQMSVVFGGLYIIFALENLFKAIKKSRSQANDEIKNTTYENAPRVDGLPDEGNSDHVTTSFSGGNFHKSASKDFSSTSGSDDTFHRHDVVCGNFTSTLIAIFIGDMLHNFADGVAIGVAFSSHWTKGISTSIAILCHELPHELGDFAIYLRNGASKWQAIGLNAIAACVAFIGLYSGINMSNDDAVRNWLLCAIAGIFIYIALVQVMGAMMKGETDKPLLRFLMQNLGIVIGWVIMVLIALYGETIHIGS